MEQIEIHKWYQMGIKKNHKMEQQTSKMISSRN
jgi:hypothetical protein